MTGSRAVSQTKQKRSAGQTLAMCYLPLVLLFTLVLLYGYAGNAVWHPLPASLIRKLWYLGITLLSLPAVVGAAADLVRRPGALRGQRKVRSLILLAGIVTAHISTIIAYMNGEATYGKILLLLMYDLVLISSYRYWNHEREWFRRGILAVSVFLWITALYGILEHFLYGRIPFIYEQAENSGRICSVFKNAIVAGSTWLMAVWMPFPSRRKWVQWVVRATYVAAIFFTISKSVWLGLAFSAGIWCLLQRKEWKKRYVFAAAGGAAVLILALAVILRNGSFVQLVFTRLKDIQTTGSFLARLQHIQDTIQYMTRESSLLHQLFGYGYSTSWKFVETSAHYYGPTVRCIDNQYFTSWFEFGAISLLCLAAWAEKCLSQVRSDDPLVRGMALGIVSMLIPLAAYDPYRWENLMVLMIPLSAAVVCGEPIPVRREVMCGAAASALVLAGFACGCPRLIRVVRTVSQYLAARSGVSAFWLEGVLWILILCLSLVLLIGIGRLVRDAVGRKRGGRGLRIAAGVSLCAMLGMGLGGEYCLNRAGEQYRPVLEEEQEVLDLIRTAKLGKLCVDEYPELYQRRFGDVAGSLFQGDGVIRADSTTVISPVEKEERGLLLLGFLFTEISPEHSVYTDDTAVIEALRSAGYHMTGYYSAERRIGIGGTGDAAVQRTIPLYSGEYTLSVSGTSEAGKTFRVQVTDDAGQLVAASEMSLPGEASEGMNVLTFSVPKEPSQALLHTMQVDIQSAEGGVPEMEVAVRQTPKLDVHTIYGYNDKVIREEYYTPEGERTRCDAGYFATSLKYDTKLDVVRQDFFDEEDQLVLTGSGYARVKWKYRDHKIVRERYYGTDKKRIALEMGYSGMTFAYDSEGRIIRRKYYDNSNHLVLRKDGYAVLEVAFDEYGQISRADYKGTEEQPILMEGGYSGIGYQRDAAGNILVQTYYGPDGNPVVTSDHFAEVRNQYDEYSRCIRTEYFGADGSRIALENGQSAETSEYDEAGRVTEKWFYDEEDRLCVVEGGYAGWLCSYDVAGNVKEVRYFGTDRQPILLPGGFASVVYEWNGTNQIIGQFYYGTAGEAVVINSGYSAVRREYDSSGRMTRESYWGAGGEPILYAAGYFEERRVYDADGNVTEWSYYGTDGQPCLRSDGFSALRYVYDENGGCLLQQYLGTDGKPVNQADGCAEIRQEFDASGNAVLTAYFDETGAMVSTAAGYAFSRRMYDGQNRLVREEFFGADEKPVLIPAGYAAVDYLRDEEQRFVETRFYGTDGERISTSGGFAAARKTYDEDWNLIQEEYFDADGSLTMIASGYAKKQYIRDESGEVVATSYYDASDRRIDP